MHVLAVSNEKVAKDSPEVQPQPMFWTYEFGKGRVFGCLLGHYTWTFDDPYFRLLLLRGIAWSARQSPYRFDALVTRGIALSQ
jgi:type 1 glutamine amidotransferase